MKMNDAPGGEGPLFAKPYLQVALGPPDAIGEPPAVYTITDDTLPPDALSDRDRSLIAYTVAYSLVSPDMEDTPEVTARVMRLLAAAADSAKRVHRAHCPDCAKRAKHTDDPQ